MSYAIISVGGKQYRVSAGERLLVDRLALEDGATFTPTVLLAGGDGEAKIAPSDVVVTAKVVDPGEGPEDPHREVQAAHGLQAPHGLPRLAHADRDRVDRWGHALGEAGAREDRRRPPNATRRAGLPEGYADLTVADIKAAASTWSPDERTAALEYEREHGKRKGAIAALESALAEEGQD